MVKDVGREIWERLVDGDGGEEGVRGGLTEE